MAPKRYLTRREIAELLGVKHTTITGYEERGLLPEPDIILGRAKGWTEENIIKWNDARPGRGVRRVNDPKVAKEREKRLELNRKLTEQNAAKTARRKAVDSDADTGATTVTATKF